MYAITDLGERYFDDPDAETEEFVIDLAATDDSPDE
jgi:hypothetical protein